MTYYSAMAKRSLGRKKESIRLLNDLLRYAKKLLKSDARVDYFVTSLPSLLFFDDELQQRRNSPRRSYPPRHISVWAVRHAPANC